MSSQVPKDSAEEPTEGAAAFYRGTGTLLVEPGDTVLDAMRALLAHDQIEPENRPLVPGNYRYSIDLKVTFKKTP